MCYSAIWLGEGPALAKRKCAPLKIRKNWSFLLRNITSVDSIFSFMNISLRLAPKKLARFPQPLRCLQQVRTNTHLSKEELARALDDQIRARYPRSSAAEVEAVVEARRGIWGGASGGV